ncbi:MAG: hypothetical protein U0S48_22775 [Solirubrobacteraceae bacterium]
MTSVMRALWWQDALERSAVEAAKPAPAMTIFQATGGLLHPSPQMEHHQRDRDADSAGENASSASSFTRTCAKWCVNGYAAISAATASASNFGGEDARCRDQPETALDAGPGAHVLDLDHGGRQRRVTAKTRPGTTSRTRPGDDRQRDLGREIVRRNSVRAAR